jgi:hypothetical protein
MKEQIKNEKAKRKQAIKAAKSIRKSLDIRPATTSDLVRDTRGEYVS